ncbi:MAG: THUMP domain-containing protein [Myxococcota bacterium]|nr:THUMP domain-containing protein [Myxococcota bacterium]
MKIFVTAAAGTEKPLKEELRELGYRRLQGQRGGVWLSGDREVAARICLHSRVAVRVLAQLGRFDCPDEDALYRGVQRQEWARFLTPDRTLAVTSVARNSRLRHTQYIAQKTKDAIVDGQRVRGGRRSSVDRHDPDVAVFVHLEKDEAGVFLDASGRSLHLRGWRTEAKDAPLKETLAAAMVRLSGWDRETPLVDPMCGSGTLAIEADLMARGVPSHPRDHRFGFERWADYDDAAAAAVDALRGEAFADVREAGPPCRGLDVDAEAVAIARRNAERAGSVARFAEAALDALRLEGPHHVLSNPPYGQRLEADAAFWDALRGAMNRHPDCVFSLLLPEEGAPRDLGERRAVRAHPLFNGRIRCRLVTWSPVKR